MFRKVRRLILSRGITIKFTSSQPVSINSILVLSSYLYLAPQPSSYLKRKLRFHVFLWGSLTSNIFHEVLLVCLSISRIVWRSKAEGNIKTVSLLRTSRNLLVFLSFFGKKSNVLNGCLAVYNVFKTSLFIELKTHLSQSAAYISHFGTKTFHDWNVFPN